MNTNEKRILDMIEYSRCRLIGGDLYDLLDVAGRLSDLEAELESMAKENARKILSEDNLYDMKVYCMKAYLAAEPEAEIPSSDEEWRELFASLLRLNEL